MSQPLLPQRPLTVRPPGLGLRRAANAAFLVLMTLFALGIAVRDLGGELADDAWVLGHAVPIRGQGTIEGKCTRHLVLVSCALTLSAGDQTRRARFAFAGLPRDSYPVTMVADPSRPDYPTTDLALDTFWNRVATLAAVLVLCAVAVPAWTLNAWRTWYHGRRLRAAFADRPLVPVVLRLEKHGRRTWRTVGGGFAAGLQRRTWTVPASAKPLYLDVGQSLVLGVGAGGPEAMPVDARGQWLGLTWAELSALLASLPPQPSR